MGETSVSVINVGEVYYILLRERGKDAADLVLSELRQVAKIG